MHKWEDVYSSIIKDLSGSISQNRFKFQRYWAINKIYELYQQPKDFVVVFDFACDVDVIIEDKIHFYQIKTSGSNSFTITKLISARKDSHSILSKLSLLEKYDHVESLNIVTNLPLQDLDKRILDFESICLNDLLNESKDKINEHIVEKTSQKADLKKYFYLKSSLCIDNSYEQLLGATVLFLENKFTTSSMRPKMFLDWLIRDSENKVTYEYDIVEIKNSLYKKGISRNYFENLLSKYKETDNVSIKEVEKIIKNEKIYSKQVELQRALKEVTLGGSNSLRISREIENIICQFESDSSILNENIDNIRVQAYNSFDIDDTFTKEQKEVLIILALVKLKRGEL